VTFLELCAALARESGAIGTAPSTVIGQTGRQEKCVNWIIEAWRLIQNLNPDWSFLRAEFQGDLALSTMNYAAAALNIDDFAGWILDQNGYLPVTIYESGDQANEVSLQFLDYQSWRTRYNRGTHDAAKPIYYSVAPNSDLLVGPKPDLAYVIRGEYQRAPQVLADNDDVPLLPERFHMAIVRRAEMLLAQHDEAPTAFSGATAKFNEYLIDMDRDCLPAIELGGNALA
jgi:hypothetical protein